MSQTAAIESVPHESARTHQPNGASRSGPEFEALASILDQLDHGLIVLTRARRVQHANAAAWRLLSVGHALLVHAGAVTAHRPEETTQLDRALDQAIDRGKRAFIGFGQDPRRTIIAIAPVVMCGEPAALLMLQRVAVCSALTAQCFGSAHGLTSAETRVLTLLSEGRAPAEIARLHGVTIATVRTQITTLRAKTGAANLRDLLCALAGLPPLVGIVPQVKW